MDATHVIITVRGGTDALLAELADAGIPAEVGGTDWVRTRMPLDATQERTVLVRSQLVLRLLRAAVTIPPHAGDAARDAVLAAAGAIRPSGSFAVRADGPDRQSLQEDVGAAIKDASGARVDLSKPDHLYFVHDDMGTFVLGEQIGGDLGKRHYKIITGPASLSGPVATAILWHAGWTPERELIAWPCGTGELAIEAALRASGKSPRAYELDARDEHPTANLIVAADPRLPMVSSAQRNAKIAGVAHAIRFSRQDLDWLDTKHDEFGVERMVGLLPNLRLHKGFVKELFYQLDYILAHGGVACFACVNDESASMIEEGARSPAVATRSYTTERTYVWSGQQSLTLVRLRTDEPKRKQRKGTTPD